MSAATVIARACVFDSRGLHQRHLLLLIIPRGWWAVRSWTEAAWRRVGPSRVTGPAQKV